jgi:Cytochrome c oxidase subunit IV
MRTWARIFLFSAGFSLVVAIVYWFVSHERAGSALLLFMYLASLFLGAYLALRWWRARPPIDDPDATHRAAAGQEVGRFAGGTMWPFVFATGALIALQGFIYGIWLLVPGLLVCAGACVGLTLQSRG